MGTLAEVVGLLKNSTTCADGEIDLNKKMSDDIIKHLMKVRRQIEEYRRMKDMVKLYLRSCSNQNILMVYP